MGSLAPCPAWDDSGRAQSQLQSRRTEMTIARILPLHIHGALEAALAVGLMAASFAFGLNPAAMVLSFALGALMLGVVFASHAGERNSLAVSTHNALDLVFSFTS